MAFGDLSRTYAHILHTIPTGGAFGGCDCVYRLNCCDPRTTHNVAIALTCRLAICLCGPTGHTELSFSLARTASARLDLTGVLP